jgi:hypothetical protein
MDGGHRRRRRSARRIAAAGLSALAAIFASGAQALACGGTDLGQARVASIPHPHTLALDDGRMVRLTGLAWQKDEVGELNSALAAAALGRQVSLKGSTIPDRYGRLHALVFVDGAQVPLQYDLLSRGLALVNLQAGGAAISNDSCAQAMLAREEEAREARRGIWNRAPVLDANRPSDILQARGRFAVVQGRVISVRDSGNTTYVNFGRRWSDDFTVTIAKRQHSAFITGGLPPRSLSGQLVRVRGTIEERAGPWIEATTPAQFELVAGRASGR